MKLPTRNNSIEIREGFGRCLVQDCGIRGGGLVHFTRKGKVEIVLCGDHLDKALDALFEPADAERRRGGS